MDGSIKLLALSILSFPLMCPLLVEKTLTSVSGETQSPQHDLMLPTGYHHYSCCHEKNSCLQSVGMACFLKIQEKETHCFKHHHPLTLIILCFRHPTRCCVMYLFFSLFQQTSDPHSSKCNTFKNMFIDLITSILFMRAPPPNST